MRFWPKFLTYPRPPDFIISDPPQVNPWNIIPRNPIFNIYLHQFLRSDEDRALHDHSWINCSLIIIGEYVEVMPDGNRLRRRFRPVFRWPTAMHRIELLPDSKPVWTVFITGPRIRQWGFQCPHGWVPWQQFTAKTESGNKIGKGCD